MMMRMTASPQLKRSNKLMIFKTYSDSDEGEPTKKKRRKESFSLCCEVLCQHIEFDDGELVYFDKLKLQREAQETHERVV